MTDGEKRDAGFTLTELLIVVAIMAILAATAVPGYSRYTTKAKQGQAQQALVSLGQYEEMYRFSHGSYTATMADLTTLGYSAGTTLYAVSVTAAGTTTFTATATGNIDSDATIDTWTIDQSGTLTNTVNDVAG